MATRRKFLGILGVGAASAPLAAKEALDKSISDLVIRGEEAAPIAPSTALYDRFNEDHDERRSRIDAAADYLRAGNPIPDYVEKKMRVNASYVPALDPDIACKRSWSMSVKIATQRERNYERQKEKMMKGNTDRHMRDAFEKLIGFKWPW